MSPKDFVFILAQRLVPQHALSRFAGKVADSQNPALKNFIIKNFVAHFKVDLSEAKIETARGYKSFNDFFTRELKEGKRPICRPPNTIASPADGAISEQGSIELGSLFQAKGHHYSLMELLAGNAEQANTYMDGSFATIYLSPKDYHRVHMPLEGTLQNMTYVPGDLYSVNQTTADNIPNLFARNERLVCEFKGKHGNFVMILVGAMIVAGIETVWAGQIAPVSHSIKSQDYTSKKSIKLKKGEEMGRFKLGSTVILLFPEKSAALSKELINGSVVQMGEEIGAII